MSKVELRPSNRMPFVIRSSARSEGKAARSKRPEAWAIVNAMPGLTMRAGEFGFRPRLAARDLKLFFSFLHGSAHYVRRVEGEAIALRVRTGTSGCDALQVVPAGRGWSQVAVCVGGKPLPEPAVRGAFSTAEIRLEFSDGLRAEAPYAVRVAPT